MQKMEEQYYQDNSLSSELTISTESIDKALNGLTNIQLLTEQLLSQITAIKEHPEFSDQEKQEGLNQLGKSIDQYMYVFKERIKVDISSSMDFYNINELNIVEFHNVQSDFFELLDSVLQEYCFLLQTHITLQPNIDSYQNEDYLLRVTFVPELGQSTTPNLSADLQILPYSRILTQLILDYYLFIQALSANPYFEESATKETYKRYEKLSNILKQRLTVPNEPSRSILFRQFFALLYSRATFCSNRITHLDPHEMIQLSNFDYSYEGLTLKDEDIISLCEQHIADINKGLTEAENTQDEGRQILKIQSVDKDALLFQDQVLSEIESSLALDKSNYIQ